MYVHLYPTYSRTPVTHTHVNVINKFVHFSILAERAKENGGGLLHVCKVQVSSNILDLSKR